MLSDTSNKIISGLKLSEEDILENLKNRHEDILYFASEEQIQALINAGRIDEDIFPEWMQKQEELGYILNQAEEEFSGAKEL